MLEQLKDDDSEYVRRSVANNLNDIAKDHPDIVAEIAKAWLVDADDNRKKLVRHACRTLIKQGHKKTLAAFGYQAMLKGEAVAIHRFRNRIWVFLVRVAPRLWVVKIMRRLLEKRRK